MLLFGWIFLNLAALVIGQGCSPTFSWSGRNCGVNCEACLNIRFNNVGRGDQACLRRSTFAAPTSNACIFQGNLNGDGSFIAVTSSTLSRIECQRSLKDLEVRHTLVNLSVYSSINEFINILSRSHCLRTLVQEVLLLRMAESVVLPLSSFLESGRTLSWKYRIKIAYLPFYQLIIPIPIG